MSDFESFGGMEDSEGGGVSAEAIERLREQMKKASGAIKAIKREEGKRKKKEDKLAALLVKLINGGTSSATLQLIVQLLQENIPAAMILAILTLSHEEIKKAAGKDLKLENYDDPEKKLLEGGKVDLTREEKKIFKKKNKELEDLDDEEALSPAMRKDINEWGESMLAAGLSAPHKTLGTVLDHEKKIKAPVVQLATFTLRDYMEMHGAKHDYEEMWEFSAAVLRAVMTKLNRAAKQIPKEIVPELGEGELRQ